MPYEPEIENIYKKLEEFIVGKLYRYHCIEVSFDLCKENQVWVKDLTRIGRAIDKMLVIDYDKRIFNRQPKNGV
jgi:TFIIF-interacting CTD phosphatase-like protein